MRAVFRPPNQGFSRENRESLGAATAMIVASMAMTRINSTRVMPAGRPMASLHVELPQALPRAHWSRQNGMDAAAWAKQALRDRALDYV